jgi:hypothetical protein
MYCGPPPLAVSLEVDMSVVRDVCKPVNKKRLEYASKHEPRNMLPGLLSVLEITKRSEHGVSRQLTLNMGL